MSRPSYANALDRLLQPLGFRREGNDWTRIRGDMWECIDLQTSAIAGVTANVAAKDLATERILRGIPCTKPLFMPPVEVRIGQLIDGYDKWWRKDPNGPAELVEAVQVYGLTWFDKVRTLEDQAARWYGRGGDRPWRSPSMIRLAVTLYRMGEISEARALFETPAPRTVNPYLLAEARCVERWLEQKAGEADPPA